MYLQHRSVTLNIVSTSSSEQLHENAYIRGRAWTKRLSHNKVITDDRDQAVTVKSPDHGWFDSIATAYAEQRPHYPDSIFRWIASQAPDQNLCWDAACGNGQASLGLADFFATVIATDLSSNQIEAAPPHPRIQFRVASAENSGLATECCSAVICATAIHWLDVDCFNQECLRVLSPGGLLVWLGYDPIQGAPAPIQQWLDDLYLQRLKCWWPPQRRHVEARYRNLTFPGKSEQLPRNHFIVLRWSMHDLLGFISTWSALRLAKQKGTDLLPKLQKELTHLWGYEETEINLFLPLMGRWGIPKPIAIPPRLT